METVWLLFLILSLVVQLAYYWLLFWPVVSDTPAVKSPGPVSVIVAAYNEANNLPHLLQSLFSQKDIVFEVQVVNDGSTDDTAAVLSQWGEQEHRLQVISLAKNKGKKVALTAGIKHAQYEHLVFIDADCVPVSNYWLAAMANRLHSYELVLGFGGYKPSNGWLNKLVRYETLLTAIQYFSYAQAGMPYMGVGRNLAYRKGAFTAQLGFSTHAHIQSGDDDLLVNAIADKGNTAMILTSSAQTLSDGPKSWNIWFRQKRRHLSTASKYRWKHKFLLALWGAAQTTFWVTFIGLLFSNSKMAWLVFLAKLLGQIPVLWSWTSRLPGRSLLLLFPVLDALLALSLPLLAFSGTLYPARKW